MAECNIGKTPAQTINDLDPSTQIRIAISFMEHNHTINEIVRRAEAIGFPVRDLCGEAEVSLSTFWRWQQPEANPRMRDMRAALDRIERVLTERERKVLASLVQRHPEAALRNLDEGEVDAK
ncbi:hypothetical protein [Agrobacterium sp. 22117]|uniref:hypothetical protein n=1 Tax=Agrobacterium sp. 22117 TaxID=3453880 RepID=UPI003F85CF1E